MRPMPMLQEHRLETRVSVSSGAEPCVSHEIAWCSPPMMAIGIIPPADPAVKTGPAGNVQGAIQVDLATGVIQVDLTTGIIQVGV